MGGARYEYSKDELNVHEQHRIKVARGGWDGGTPPAREDAAE